MCAASGLRPIEIRSRVGLPAANGRITMASPAHWASPVALRSTRIGATNCGCALCGGLCASDMPLLNENGADDRAVQAFCRLPISVPASSAASVFSAPSSACRGYPWFLLSGAVALPHASLAAARGAYSRMRRMLSPVATVDDGICAQQPAPAGRPGLAPRTRSRLRNHPDPGRTGKARPGRTRPVATPCRPRAR